MVYLRLFRYMRSYKRPLALGVFFMCVYTAFNGISLFSIVPFFDRVLMGRDFVLTTSVPVIPDEMLMRFQNWINSFDRLMLLHGLLVFVFTAILLKEFANYFQRVFFEMVGQGIIRDVRNDLFAHIQTLSLEFFGKNRTGELISRITNDVGMLLYAVSGRFATNILHVFQVLLYLFIVIVFGWRLALTAVVMFSVIMLPIAMIGRKVRRLSRRVQKKMGEISSIIKESCHGIRVVKAFCMEESENRKFAAQTEKYMSSNVKIVRKSALMSPLTQVIGTAIAVFLLNRGMVDVIEGRMSSGAFVVFIAALVGMIKPAQAIAKLNENLQLAGGALDRIYGVLDMKSSVVDKPGAVRLEGFRESIEFRDVDFSYEPEKQALKGVSLSVAFGEVIALSGHSGSGKTTLVNLVARFYDPCRGAVLMDGRDIRDCALSDLRGLIGMVTQDTILFNDTVLSNITCGRPDADRAEAERAARVANAHDFIMALPDGYDTVVGENGAKLSGGEKQRVTIARAVCKNPPILILDEATSALDSQSEKLVQEALGKLMEGRTVFVIAHRLSTIRRADRIVVLREGEIAEIGNHEELMARDGGVYRGLYELQHHGAAD